jgi:Uncharacterised nucleotidyltransferase
MVTAYSGNMTDNTIEQLVVHRVRAAFGFVKDSSLPQTVSFAARSLAERHGVLHAFDRGAEKTHLGTVVSPDVMTNIQMQVELRNITRALNAAEIDFLLFQGLALYQRCYGKILRPCADIDVLVHPWAYSQTRAFLKEIGITESRGVLRSSTGLEIDLRTSAVEPYIARCPDVSEMFSRRRWDPALDAYTLSDSDHLFVLLMHGFKQDWRKLVWILDVALLVREAAEAELSRLEILARRFNARKRVTIGLVLAHRYFPQPRTLNASVSADDQANALIHRYRSRLFQQTPDTCMELYSGIFGRRAAYDGFGQWVRYIRDRSLSAILQRNKFR